MLLRCKKCREVLTEVKVRENDCAVINKSSVLYLQDDSLPDWIKTEVDKVSFLKQTMFIAVI